MTTTLLEVHDLTVHYSGTARPALDAVALTVHAGETVAIVGESGSGKSTLAHALVGLLPSSAWTASGAIRFHGADLSDLDERQWRAFRGGRIGFVPQDPTQSLNPLMTIGAQLSEVFRLHAGLSAAEATLAAVEALRQVGLSEPEARVRQYPHELSGGMQQRVLIAIALAGEPELLIADEPTSALDVTVQRTVLDVLAERAAATGTAVILITHDLGVATDRAQRIVVLQNGHVVESGASETMLTAPVEAYTRDLIGAAPSLSSARYVDDTAPADSRPRLDVVEVSRSYTLPGRVHLTAVAEASFTVGEGRTLAVVGESGSGKTTLARIIAGSDRPDSGTILLDGADVSDLGRRRLPTLGRQVQLVHQHPGAAMNPRWSIGRIIAEPLTARGRYPHADRERRVRDLLDRVALDPALADRRPSQLSGGQRQRVAIARALAAEPRLIVLDEPVSALDVVVQAQVLDLLAALQRDQGLSYLFVSHDLAVVRQIAHDVIVLRRGEIVESGTVDAVYSAPQHDYTRTLLDAIPGTAHRRDAPHQDSPVTGSATRRRRTPARKDTARS